MICSGHRDLFVDMLDDLLGGWRAGLAHTVFRRVEKWTFPKTSLIMSYPQVFRIFLEKLSRKSHHGISKRIDDEFMHVIRYPRGLRE